MTTDLPYVALLASDGWRDVSEYVSSRDYVYVKGFAARAPHPSVAIARRGKYETSYWWNPAGAPLSLAVGWWKPFPDDGILPHQRWLDFSNPQDGRFVRPPEPVYPPAGVDAKLTPVPLKLLMAMHGGDILQERAWRWTEWLLTDATGSSERITERGINALRKLAFIERDGVLPPGRLPHWHGFDWKITGAGKAWIEANGGRSR